MIAVSAFVDAGLGHSSYLVQVDRDRALVIDPARLPVEQCRRARALGIDIAFTADTHTHADYISGSAELAAAGATFLAPRTAALEIAHQPIADGDEVRV